MIKIAGGVALSAAGLVLLVNYERGLVPAGAAAVGATTAGATGTAGVIQTPAGVTVPAGFNGPPIGKDGVYTGIPSMHEYGPVQVKATVSGGRLTQVDVVQFPTGDPRSVSLSYSALPKLTSEAVTGQTSQVAAVTGATLTSNSFKISLQSAIDEANVGGAAAGVQQGAVVPQAGTVPQAGVAQQAGVVPQPAVVGGQVVPQPAVVPQTGVVGGQA